MPLQYLYLLVFQAAVLYFFLGLSQVIYIYIYILCSGCHPIFCVLSGIHRQATYLVVTALFPSCYHIKLLVECCGTSKPNITNKKMRTETQYPKVLLGANVCTEGLGRRDYLLHDRSAKKTL